MAGKTWQNPLYIGLILMTVFIIVYAGLGDPAGLSNYLIATELVIVVFYLVYLAVISFYIRRIEDARTRLTATKIAWIILVLLGFSTGVLIWVENEAEILVILGLLWGAMAIALRDMLQNFFGSLAVVFTRVFRIGDRITVRGYYGEVMDIGLLRSTLMELDRQAGDKPTGEIITLPNGTLFREIIGNTSKHTSVTWDEIRISLPPGADPGLVRGTILPVIEKHTAAYREQAVRQLDRLAEKKYVAARDVAPTALFDMDDRGVTVHVRYVVPSGKRAEVRNSITEELAPLVALMTGNE